MLRIVWLIFWVWVGYIVGSLYNGVYASTFKEAQEVFAKLQNLTGYHIVLKYSKDSVSNAYSTANCVIITQGMLNDCTNNGQLAMVLGHELGHYIMQDYRVKDNKSIELRADKLGYTFCKKLGYRDCLSFPKMMKARYGDKEGMSHPSWSKRIKELLR